MSLKFANIFVNSREFFKNHNNCSKCRNKTSKFVQFLKNKHFENSGTYFKIWKKNRSGL